jgi:hypothetical protein
MHETLTLETAEKTVLLMSKTRDKFHYLVLSFHWKTNIRRDWYT